MLTLLSASWLCLLAAPAGPALFDSAGRPVTEAELVQRAAGADVVLFGEQHDDPVGHRLELALAQGLCGARVGQVTFGLEMLETDVQLIVDEFLAGLIRDQDLKNEARVWPNHAIDYQPLLDLAKEARVPVIASNIPRRYAALVAREGLGALDRLSDAAKRWLAPLPIPVDLSLPGYQGLIAMAGEHGGVKGERLAQAQAVKDATMAWSILKAWQPGRVVLHLNGTYHSQHHEGIVWYLRRARPELRSLTVATTNQADLTRLAPESRDLADVILVRPEPAKTG